MLAGAFVGSKRLMLWATCRCCRPRARSSTDASQAIPRSSCWNCYVRFPTENLRAPLKVNAFRRTVSSPNDLRPHLSIGAIPGEAVRPSPRQHQESRPLDAQRAAPHAPSALRSSKGVSATSMRTPCRSVPTGFRPVHPARWHRRPRPAFASVVRPLVRTGQKDELDRG